MDDKKHTLLVYTIGGSPEPIVASLKRWQPVRVHFVPTVQSRDQIDAKIVPMAQSEGLALDPGRYDVLELRDGQDFAAIVDTLRQLTPVVAEWLGRGDSYQVVVDLTGGTKCMSAALALQAHRWRCVFSYVGGTERTKEGLGIVVSGKEQVLYARNPWDALGYQAVEEIVALFDQQSFSPAAALADKAMRLVTEPARKQELTSLKLLADAFDAWDRFDHQAAKSKLQDLAKHENNLRAVLGPNKAAQLLSCVHGHISYLHKLVESDAPNRQYVTDLLANALRRKTEGRVDDAVARLYRAIESLAQVGLAERHQIKNTKQVPLDRVPEPLRGQWTSRAEEGMVFLGLQDAYALLAAASDALGVQFRELRLHERERSPLTARNQSILAHGFERVSDKVFQQLWKAALELAQVSEADLPMFPKIAT